MREFSKPMDAAVVAAPMRKLWPANCSAGRFAFFSTFRTSSTNCNRVRGRPSCQMNSGPGLSPRFAKYDSKAVTRQSLSLVRPTVIRTPCRKGSVFDFLRWIAIMEGLSLLSTAMSSVLWGHNSSPRVQLALLSGRKRKSLVPKLPITCMSSRTSPLHPILPSSSSVSLGL